MILKNRILCIELLALLAVLTFARTAACDEWQAVREAAQGIKSVKTRFIQEKHMKILKAPLVSKGELFFQKPDSLRWEYKSPVETVLLMHGGKTRRYTRKDGVMDEDSGMGLEAMRFVMVEINAWLAGNFNNNPSFRAEMKGKNRILMTPVGAPLSGMIGKIEINLSPKPGVIDSVLIYEDSESYSLLKFIDPVLNEDIAGSIFEEL